MDAGKGQPMLCLTWQELLSCEHLTITAARICTAHSNLGMTLISTNTLALGLIGTERPHYKNMFGNNNLVFGSEVALLGTWEYMSRILVTVHRQRSLCGYLRSLHTESIEWFIEDHAFSPSYDFVPPPPPSLYAPFSKLSLFLSLHVCVAGRAYWQWGGGGGGGGGGGAKS